MVRGEKNKQIHYFVSVHVRLVSKKRTNAFDSPNCLLWGKICMKPIIYKSTPEQSGFDN